MGLTGWVKNHREILDHWVSQDPHMFALWQRLILEANHQETKKMFNGALTTIRRGELVFGLEAWEAKTGISKKVLRRCLKTLEDEGMVGRQRTNKCSIISIVNYDKYQSSGSQEAGEGQAEGKQRASRGQHRNNVNNGENVKEEIDMVISYLNDRAGRKFKNVQGNAKHINARLKEGHTVEEMKTVIDKKVAEWKGGTMDEYLRPSTLFNSEKFEGYLNASGPTKSNRHSGFDDRDYSAGINQDAGDDEPNF